MRKLKCLLKLARPLAQALDITKNVSFFNKSVFIRWRCMLLLHYISVLAYIFQYEQKFDKLKPKTTGVPSTWGCNATYIFNVLLFHLQHPDDVDYRVMQTFVEFYTTLLGFINFKLYHSINLHYPPKVSSQPHLTGNFQIFRPVLTEIDQKFQSVEDNCCFILTARARCSHSSR